MRGHTTWDGGEPACAARGTLGNAVLAIETNIQWDACKAMWPTLHPRRARATITHGAT